MPSLSVAQGNLLKLFATPVVTDQLPQADSINAELAPLILARMAGDAGMSVSNRGGWHSQRDLSEWVGDGARLILRHAQALADAHTEKPQAGVTWQTDAWANVSAGGHFNMPHVHGGTFWSAVYYVAVGEGQGGELVLHDPRMPALQMHAPGVRFRGLGAEGEVAITPRPGLMVLFPGWLAHSVEPWQGSGQRISIAMNLRAVVVAKPNE
jgi:uncharacterized protein (TIGR02466 family)